MKYLDPNGLAKLKQADDARLDRLYRKKSTRSWTLTAKAGAVSLWPVGGTPLKPVVDFLFAETPPSSGDKAPDNPSTITGESSVKVTRCGKNLFSFVNYSLTKNGVTVTADSTGLITINGTSTASGTVEFTVYSRNIPISAGQAIAFTYKEISGTATPPEGTDLFFGVQCSVVGTNVSTFYFGIYNTTAIKEQTKSFAEDRKISSLTVKVYSGRTYNNYKFRVQLELGDVCTDYEQPAIDIYTLPLGNTYYGGTLDVASGVMTVTWQGVVYDGTENITKQADLQDGTPQYNLPVPSYRASRGGGEVDVGTHFPFGYTANTGYVRSSGGYGYRVYPVGYDTRESFVSFVSAQYAAGTPLTVAYKIATPFTVQLTPTEILSLAQTDKYTPRLNTIYTNASAVQVSYVKSPIREEYELTQAIVGQGGNI